MLKHLFLTPRRPSDALRNELASLCRAQQLQALDLPRDLKSDLGADCGCIDNGATRLERRFP